MQPVSRHSTTQTLTVPTRTDQVQQFTARIYQWLKAGRETTQTTGLELGHACGNFNLVKQIRACRVRSQILDSYV